MGIENQGDAGNGLVLGKERHPILSLDRFRSVG